MTQNYPHFPVRLDNYFMKNLNLKIFKYFGVIFHRRSSSFETSKSPKPKFKISVRSDK
jgi:hypothetical protein